jgi:Domain of unknown function (DUF4124)
VVRFVLLTLLTMTSILFHVKLFNRSVTTVALTLANNSPPVDRARWPLLTQLGVAATVQKLAMVVVLAAGVLPAGAAIHKCTGSDGKVTFGDQPCAVGHSAATVKPAAAPTVQGAPIANNLPGGAVPKDPDAAARAAAFARIRASQTPQCLALGDRIAALVEKGSQGVTGVEIKAMVDRYEQQCAAQARAANAAENARNEARQKQLIVDEECKVKRRVLAERRPRLASLSLEDQKAFAAVETDVARGCQ